MNNIWLPVVSALHMDGDNRFGSCAHRLSIYVAMLYVCKWKINYFYVVLTSKSCNIYIDTT